MAQISARSKTQAMDYSLVLASQGIESVIQQSPDGSIWSLLVQAKDYERALSSLRLYRRENRGWPWQQQLFRPGILFDWGALAWVLLLVVFYWIASVTGITPQGIVDSTAIAHGQWWRLFTAVWLHGDLAHLAANATFGLILLGLAMGRFGPGSGLLFSYLAGAAGNAAACLLDASPHRSLGASGMVMGSLGLLAGQTVATLGRPLYPSLRFFLSGIAGGVMLFILFGVTPGTDVVAHTGGFICGTLFGAGLSYLPHVESRPWVNTFFGVGFVLLSLLPWWLAATHSKP